MIKTPTRSLAFTFLKFFSLGILLLSTSCSSLPNSAQSAAKNLATKAALKVAQPALEKIFFAEAPLLPLSRSLFPLVDKLPSKAPFNPIPLQKNSISYDKNGLLLLAPGDYVIPVMTYCMKVQGSSPTGYTYILASLQGTRAKIIREINQKAIPQFAPSDVQVLSWSLQAGMNYQDLSAKSRQIIDTVTPGRIPELQESFLQNFESEWDSISLKSNGIIPSFELASDELFSNLGEAGQTILEMRSFRRKIRSGENDFASLSSLIDVKKVFPPPPVKDSWSKISPLIYARFITKTNFQKISYLQIRVLPSSPPLKSRSPSSKNRFNQATNAKTPVDIFAWVADPQNSAIQPLSFSLIVGSQGVLLLPSLVEMPLIAAATLSAILAAEIIDWNAFAQLQDLLKNVIDAQVQKLIQEGNHALKVEHDELEKPARDLGIIDHQTKDTSTDKRSSTREYQKQGGEEALQKDFDKFPAKVTVAADGTETKILPDGKTIVKRPTKDGKAPTLEIQPAKDANGRTSKLRVKVRYTK